MSLIIQKGPGKCIPIKFASCNWVFHWKVGNQLKDMHTLGVFGLLAREMLLCWSKRNICPARRNKMVSKPGQGTLRLYPYMSESEMGAQNWNNDIWNCGNPRGKSTMQKTSFPRMYLTRSMAIRIYQGLVAYIGYFASTIEPCCWYVQIQLPA